MTRVTAELLERAGACEDQVKLFAGLWPEGVEVTRELCVEHAADFDWDWASENLLPEEGLRACDEARASARRACDEAIGSARRAYKEATASAWRVYKEATASAWRVYKEATASAFADAVLEFGLEEQV